MRLVPTILATGILQVTIPRRAVRAYVTRHNWDSLASDIFFDRQLARTINVDVRFMLFMMDRWGHADRLLQEINAK